VFYKIDVVLDLQTGTPAASARLKIRRVEREFVNGLRKAFDDGSIPKSSGGLLAACSAGVVIPDGDKAESRLQVGRKKVRFHDGKKTGRHRGYQRENPRRGTAAALERSPSESCTARPEGRIGRRVREEERAPAGLWLELNSWSQWW